MQSGVLFLVLVNIFIINLQSNFRVNLGFIFFEFSYFDP